MNIVPWWERLDLKANSIHGYKCMSCPCHRRVGRSVMDSFWNLWDILRRRWVSDSTHWDTPVTHRDAYAILMAVDILVPNRQQAINNHHAVYWRLLYDNSYINSYHAHYSDVIMSTIASQTSAFRLFTQPFVQAYINENIEAPPHWPLWGEFTGVRWIHRWIHRSLLNSPHQGPVTRKMFPFDDVIMNINIHETK